MGKCICIDDYEGDFCHIPMPKGCASSPCVNGATCINLPNSKYECTCPPDYTGSRCIESTSYYKNISILSKSDL